MKEIVNTDQAPAPIGPYNQATKANGLLFASGQIAIDPGTGKLVDGSIEDETRQVMKNLGAVLEAGGCNFSDIVKTTIFIRDMGQFSSINSVYGEFFETAPPARETVEVSRLPKDVRVEISCIAIIP
ncbi:MAG: RidA family protein [Bacteroidota bacterium]